MIRTSIPSCRWATTRATTTRGGYYKGSLIVLDRVAEQSHNQLYINYPWHPDGGPFKVLSAAEEK